MAVRGGGGDDRLAVAHRRYQPKGVYSGGGRVAAGPGDGYGAAVFCRYSGFQGRCASDALQIQPLLIQGHPAHVGHHRYVTPQGGGVGVGHDGGLAGLLGRYEAVAVHRRHSGIGAVPLVHPVVEGGAGQIELIDRVPVIVLDLHVQPALVQAALCRRGIFLVQYRRGCRRSRTQRAGRSAEEQCHCQSGSKMG